MDLQHTTAAALVYGIKISEVKKVDLTKRLGQSVGILISVLKYNAHNHQQNQKSGQFSSFLSEQSGFSCNVDLLLFGSLPGSWTSNSAVLLFLYLNSSLTFFWCHVAICALEAFDRYNSALVLFSTRFRERGRGESRICQRKLERFLRIKTLLDLGLPAGTFKAGQPTFLLPS